MDNKQFIATKIAQFVNFVDTEQNPVFIVTATILKLKSKKANIKLTPYFFSDTDKEMSKEQKLIILNFLAQFAKDEKKTL